MNGGMKKLVGRFPKREELSRNGFREEIARVTFDRYRAQRVVVKRAVQVAKRMADRRWEERLGNNFVGTKRCFGKR